MAPSKDKPIQREKQAWEWAKSTEPENISEQHVLTAYRLTVSSCTHVTNRRNCRGNPKCLLGIGERDWLQDRPDSSWHDIEDPELERRSQGSFVGLKNLGATCYVNTLLQVWFHNIEFRAVIYKYYDKPTASLCPAATLYPAATLCPAATVCPAASVYPGSTSELNLPTSILGNLQYVFALLQDSKRRFIDPTPFIQSMGLNTTQQQDAQEFSKLFMSLLQETLQCQADPELQNFVQSQFCGEYAYFTQCQTCKSVKLRPSNFYELDLNIKGHKDINQCLGEFLREEKLEDDNRYMCETCCKKQNAVRKIVLKQLPKILNLQLLRFVFDRNTGQKKKLSNFIQFPEELDMGIYITDSDKAGQYVYELQAVLIHRGPTAYSGHYIAHIRAADKLKSWYKFNDEDIEKMKGKDLHLGCEDEIQIIDDDSAVSMTASAESTSTKGKKQKVPKGCHTSKNAYMLVYKLRNSDNSARYEEAIEPILPQRLQELVARDNVKFEEWIKEMVKMRDENISCGKIKQEEMRKLFDLMQPQDDASGEWISQDWLSKFLADTITLKTIQNIEFLCIHNKLDPDKVGKLKWINKQAADLIYAKHKSIGPRLDSESLCWDCVRQRCHSIRLKVRIAEDQLFFNGALKADVDPSEAQYWVGKMSLRQWKKLASENVSSEFEVNGKKDISDDGPDVHQELTTTQPSSTCDKTLESKSCLLENDQTNRAIETVAHSSSDLGTENGKSVEDGCVAKEVQKSAEEVGNEIAFNEDLLCIHRNLTSDTNCRRLVSLEVWTRLNVYFPAAPQFTNNDNVCKLCQDCDMEEAALRECHIQIAGEMKAELSDLFHNRGRPNLNTSVDQLYIVTKSFIDQWRKFLKNPSRCDPVLSVINEVLLCSHAKLIADPMQPNHDLPNVQQMCFLYETEWKILERQVSVDKTISLLAIRDNGSVTVVTDPETCGECIATRINAEELSKRDFTNKRIFIQKVLNDTDTSNKHTVHSTLTPDDTAEFQLGIPAKRRKMDTDSSPLDVNNASAGNIRRSSRHRKVRGEKEVIVSSNLTLRDLKLQLMKLFSVAPFDQHLYLDDRRLTDESATLHNLGILPDCVLKLKVDEPTETALLYADVITSTQPEEGFKGTGLITTSTS
ncbi:ubiquitin carboxyl-terminal hydrolase 48-like [Tubulanus polymorphus]|uniref:ubiquitin carboxyl-terminal hydrolase 48-like n=1 Tax=Tubulanus polymorphus TaxID=672921 RepID=UPI003DA3032C